MELCKGYEARKWAALNVRLEQGDRDAWDEAIGVFERRIEERYLRCVDRLLEQDTQENLNTAPGFTVMAICCLLIDTLNGFYGKPRSEPEKCPVCKRRPPPDTRRAFVDFLTSSTHFHRDFDRNAASDFSQNVRNAVLHSAETRSGWLIRKDEPAERIVEKKGPHHYLLNRTRFFAALRREFSDYLNRLRAGGENGLRRRFRDRMTEICKSDPELQPE